MRRREDKAKLNNLSFYKRWPKIKNAGDPAYINWDNIGKSKREKNFRNCCSWFGSGMVLLICIFSLVTISDFLGKNSDSRSLKFCPSYMSKEEAQLDK